MGIIEPSFLISGRTEGALAQSVEQWIENPRVPSSILGGATISFMVYSDCP